MISVRDHRRLCQERLSANPFIAPPDSSSPLESGDKLSDQPAWPLGIKYPIADAPATTTNVPKYSKDDLQKILKAVLEA